MDPRWQTNIENHLTVRFPWMPQSGHGVYLKGSATLEVVVAIAWGMCETESYCEPHDRFVIAQLDLDQEVVILNNK